MFPAQGHNAVMQVRPGLATPPSQIKHTTTEPLGFLKSMPCTLLYCQLDELQHLTLFILMNFPMHID